MNLVRKEESCDRSLVTRPMVEKSPPEGGAAKVVDVPEGGVFTGGKG